MNNLLIVDDEDQIRNTLSRVFMSTGYVVRVASDGFAALEQMREALPDVLLSDLNMPGMSGFELLSVVRRRLPHVYVIATSGAYAGEGVPEGIAADAFYEKASNFAALMEMVRAAAAAAPPVREDKDAPPLWINRIDVEEVGESVGIISCPECLRGYPQPLEGAAGEVRETACRDCRATIRYAVVKPLDPATSQPYPPDAEV